MTLGVAAMLASGVTLAFLFIRMIRRANAEAKALIDEALKGDPTMSEYVRKRHYRGWPKS